MKTRHHRIIVSLVLGVLAICSPTVLKSEDAGLQLASREWATVSGDAGNTRYSTLNRINAQTITTLAGAWTSLKFEAVGAGRAMPVIKDGLLFITAGSSIYAYNAKTGATVWQHSTDVQPASAALAEYNRSDKGL